MIVRDILTRSSANHRESTSLRGLGQSSFTAPLRQPRSELKTTCVFRTMRMILIAAAGSLILSLVLRAARPPTRRAPKPINWNHSYYSQKFGLCKKLRIFNPVELVKAQAWSTDAFRKCGPPIVIEFAQRYHFPVYAIETVTHSLCWAANFIYARIANDGHLIVPADTPTGVLFEAISALNRTLAHVNHTFIAKHRGQRFYITHQMTSEFLYTLLGCLFTTKYVTQPDADVLKHAVNHYRIILL